MDIDGLETSVRTYNILKNQGIETVEELIRIPLRDILRFKNCGRTSFLEMLSLVQDVGYDFEEFGHIRLEPPDGTYARVRLAIIDKKDPHGAAILALTRAIDGLDSTLRRIFRL